MTRTCTLCRTPIRRHVLVINDKDYHRKTCFCTSMGHKLEGDKFKPKPCRDCEPGEGGKSKKPDKRTRTRSSGRKPRAVMIVS